MTDKEDVKKKTKQIYEVLPKLDDQRCGYRTCGEFARAVALGEAPCYGCISGGPYVAAKVCEIMGVKGHNQVIPQYNYLHQIWEPQTAGAGGRIGRGMGWSTVPGRGYFAGWGRGRGAGRGRCGRGILRRR